MSQQQGLDQPAARQQGERRQIERRVARAQAAYEKGDFPAALDDWRLAARSGSVEAEYRRGLVPALTQLDYC